MFRSLDKRNTGIITSSDIRRTLSMKGSPDPGFF